MTPATIHCATIAPSCYAVFIRDPGNTLYAGRVYKHCDNCDIWCCQQSANDWGGFVTRKSALHSLVQTFIMRTIESYYKGPHPWQCTSEPYEVPNT